MTEPSSERIEVYVHHDDDGARWKWRHVGEDGAVVKDNVDDKAVLTLAGDAAEHARATVGPVPVWVEQPNGSYVESD